MPSHRERAFLLTRQWRDTRNGVQLVLWARAESGPVRIQLDRKEAVCFVESDLATDLSGLPHRRRSLSLRTLAGAPVDALYFRSRRDLVSARDRIRHSGRRTFESDVKPTDRFLMEHFVTGGLEVEGVYEEHVRFRAYRNPKLKPSEYRPGLTVLSVDIETGGEVDGDGDGDGNALYSVSTTGIGKPHTFLLRAEWEHFRHPEDVELSVHHDETSLLEAFFAHVAHCDPDVLVGWNVIDFDLHVLQSKCRKHAIAFALGRGTDRAALLEPSSTTGRRVARIPGRAVLDGIDTLRSATLMFEDFALEAVSKELIGRGKLIADEVHKLREIRRLYRDEPWKLVEYNVEDCKLVEEVFGAAGLIDFAVERARLTGLAIDRVGGSVAAFDNLYLPRLHRSGRVAGDVEERTGDVMSPGGYVMDSKPGLLANVIVLDFKSLYPSIIRTFRVDPLGLAEAGEEPETETIEGYREARFSRKHHILPGLIEELWRARDEAKRGRNEALSRAIKIIMNSFYGVLGTPGCRFFEPRLAASITLRGHDIIGTSREWIEAEGHDVVYGDTDSLFVHLGEAPDEDACRAIGMGLADELNAKWSDHLRERYGLESFLELEFETHYLRFFMPTVRGSEQGSKKRYAGLVRSESGRVDLTFTGLEAVRSDWTPLAREFQREVYRRVFLDEPFEDYVRETVDGLFDGRYDAKLVYRKRMRRGLEDYRKNVPPHVQAARKSEQPARWSRWVRYVMTVNGPEPVDKNPSALDHQHYLDRQLAPAADALLAIRGTSVARIVDAQLRLF